MTPTRHAAPRARRPLADRLIITLLTLALGVLVVAGLIGGLS